MGYKVAAAIFSLVVPINPCYCSHHAFEMELELVVVSPNLAISLAVNRISKIEAVMMSHDPAKNNCLLPMCLCSRELGPGGCGDPQPPEDS